MGNRRGDRWRVEVDVPATSANLGPGFDCLGLALNLVNRIQVEAEGFAEKSRRGRAWPAESRVSVTVSGQGKGLFSEDRYNLVVRAMGEVFRHVGLFPSRLAVSCENGIPACGGLGSSAAAILGGCLAARALVEAAEEAGQRSLPERISDSEILRVATALEGHPDNIAAAWLGGLTAAASEEATGEVHTARLPLSRDSFRAVLALPETRLATKAARKVLPHAVKRPDAVFGIQRTALLLGALAAGDGALLGFAMADRLHQPYRFALVPGMREAVKAARREGALGAAISGAGPAVIALVEASAGAEEAVGLAMADAFGWSGVAARWLATEIRGSGATVRRLR